MHSSDAFSLAPAPREFVLVAQARKAKSKEADASDLLVQLGVWGGVLLLMLILAGMVVRKFRENARGSREKGADLLSNFQEMRREGDIDDAEFRNIKAVLGNQLRSNVKSGKIKP